MKIITTVPRLPRRKPNTHKGDYGKLLIISGARGMTGAAYLVAMGALRSGAGLVYLAVPKSQQPILATKLTEVITWPLPETRDGAIGPGAKDVLLAFIRSVRDVDVIALGPGIGRHLDTVKSIQEFMMSCQKPMVIDADGLNAIADPKYLATLVRTVANDIILTPHSGEMARLINKSASYVELNRQKVAMDLAKSAKVIVALKGYKTVVTDGNRVYINNTGNPGMATAGSGDVLTGIIAGFLGQRIEPFSAVQLAVYLHGKSGDTAARQIGQYGLISSDIIKYLPLTIRSQTET